MSFVNTVDIVGDDALAASILDRSITGIARPHKILCNRLKATV